MLIVSTCAIAVLWLCLPVMQLKQCTRFVQSVYNIYWTVSWYSETECMTQLDIRSFAGLMLKINCILYIYESIYSQYKRPSSDPHWLHSNMV